MIVQKFGGGILKSPEAVQQMLNILLTAGTPAVVLVSALNKMTNAFERIAGAWFRHEDPEPQLQRVRGFHFDLACRLFRDPDASWNRRLKPLFDEINRILLQEPGTDFDRAYDQVVPYGELLSAALVRTFFEENGFRHRYVDARDLIVTDEVYRDAGVLWQETRDRMQDEFFDARGMVLSQGFIGRSVNGDTVTLGREGSDYSAAIFAYCLDASEVRIWKDVPGILSADPEDFPDTFKLDEISYHEAIELAYFGAKVIHPKTIKPLQNKQIPLWVKDFWHPGESGTLITEMKSLPDPRPLFIIKKNQVLISFQPRDFSFIVEDMLSEIFAQLYRYRVKVNLMQHGAVSFSVCVNADMDRINSLIQNMLPRFRILYNSGLELVTIRRYSPEAIRRITEGRRVMVQQMSRKTARFVLA